MEFKHIPVMPRECIEGLDIKPDGIYLDGTLGGGGHSELILEKLTTGRLIAIDKDAEAIENAKKRLAKYLDKITFINDDFKKAIEHLDEMKVDKLDGVLLDLGVSSYQLDNEERGFSYSADAPLDMRMDQTQYLTAYKIVNEYKESDIANIIWEYGEDRLSRKIAYNICRQRQEKPIETTGELASIIERSYPPQLRWKGGNPCKRTFQAIRIEVNGELRDLDKAAKELTLRLRENGRICILTFHSLEDRIIKRTFQALETQCICPPHQPICNCNKRQEIAIITKKPLTAQEDELAENSRANCAKLRIAQRK